MRAKAILLPILILLLGASWSGCATPAANRAAPGPSGPPGPAPEAIAGDFVSRGRDLEGRGFPVRALRQYRIALAVQPEDPETRKAVNRLDADLSARADERVQAGLAFHKQGKYEQARREFLAALRLKPDHHRAAEMLVSRVRVQSKRYIVHRVEPGETLAGLAKRYYGDYNLFPEIARYNNLADATRVLVGQELRIPAIEGVPFLTGEARVETREERPPEYSLWERGGYEAEANAEVEAAAKEAQEAQEKAQTAACLANGISLFEREKYRQAVEELERALEAMPQDETAREYAFKAHFRLAEELFEKKQYLAARERFLASLRIRVDCVRCHQYARKSEELYKEAHYRRGMQYYNEEKLIEAIREWERVRVLDPDYKRVDYLIEKSNRILANLEDLKKSKEERRP
jgi:tetratricopeptide (TPR) repeat protein